MPSLTVACGFFSFGMWDLVLPAGIKPGPLHWEHRVLAARLPGKPLTFLSSPYPVFPGLSTSGAGHRLLSHIVETALCHLATIKCSSRSGSGASGTLIPGPASGRLTLLWSECFPAWFLS